MEVLHNSCNMCTRVMPNLYNLIPRACGPRDSGVHIRQNTHVHVTTIKCIVSIYVATVYTYTYLVTFSVC